MKKITTAVFFALATTTALAGGFGSVEYSSRDGEGTTADAAATKVTMGTDINQMLKADFSLRQKTDTSDNLSDTRFEGGLTASQSIPNTVLSVYGRAALGEKFKTATNYTYYSVEPGVKYTVSPSLSLKAGYRYRAATDTANADTTRSWRLGAELALTKNYFVTVGYDRVRGDSNYNAVNAGAGFKF